MPNNNLLAFQMKNVGVSYIFLCTLSCIVLIRGWGVQAAPASHLVHKLPGQPEVGFKQYAGYVTVNSTAGRALFYYFAEADVGGNAKALDYPITIWINGGPGCSSVGGGAFTEIGPFFPSSDGRGLRINDQSWNKASNLLFIDSPAGVGWSYSNTTSDYSSFGDAETAIDTLKFFLGWLQLFPEYKNCELYLSGESYAGHHVTVLASLIFGYKGSDEFKFNLKGIAMANPLLKLSVDGAVIYDYYWSHGMISDVLHEDIVTSCDFQGVTLEIPYNVSETCFNYIVEADNMVGDVYITDVIRDVCNKSLAEQELILGRKVAHISIGVDVCMGVERDFYFNIPKVQKALHANVTNLVSPYGWSTCTGVLDYHLADSSTDMLPFLKDLHMQGLRIWVFRSRMLFSWRWGIYRSRAFLSFK